MMLHQNYNSSRVLCDRQHNLLPVDHLLVFRLAPLDAFFRRDGPVLRVRIANIQEKKKSSEIVIASGLDVVNTVAVKGRICQTLTYHMQKPNRYKKQTSHRKHRDAGHSQARVIETDSELALLYQYCAVHYQSSIYRLYSRQ